MWVSCESGYSSCHDAVALALALVFQAVYRSQFSAWAMFWYEGNRFASELASVAHRESG